MHREGVFDHHVPMQGSSALANSSGVAKVGFGPVPQGYVWYIERYSVHCPTAAAVASVFVVHGTTGTAAVDTSFRADYTTAGKDAVGDAFHAIYVPEGYHFLVQWTSATNLDQCVASIQYAVHELDPLVRGIMSGQDVRQLSESHESIMSPLTHSAIGNEAD